MSCMVQLAAMNEFFINQEMTWDEEEARHINEAFDEEMLRRKEVNEAHEYKVSFEDYDGMKTQISGQKITLSTTKRGHWAVTMRSMRCRSMWAKNAKDVTLRTHRTGR